ncbi:TonB-dependent receptor [Sphingomonas arantia]|uniref:TonB-dependent receptor n=1 Tax=Sphingomonas arantia TaxID=1460676 RepID=A0ABW4TUF7_9SPHN
MRRERGAPVRSNSGFGRALMVVGAVVPAAHAACQVPPDARPEAVISDGDVVVIGRRGAVQTDLQPVATLDSAAIAASGATSIAELLRPLRAVTQSGDGQEPIFLLNAQRVSGYQDIGNLPPEAIERVDVLPEPVALQYGYPPTRRVVNFITKRRFRQVAVKAAAGGTTRGGGGTKNAHVDLTRLANDRRLTLSFDARHTDNLLQSRHNIRPDPDVPFDARGNVTGLGGEIDPGLSALAGQVVTIAPVPIALPDLAGFAAAPNQPRLFDIAPFRSLAPANDTIHGEAVLADRIGPKLSGSVTVTADHSRDVTLFGPAGATLFVPADNPFSPFANDVLLQRYLVEASQLRQRVETTTLHAGGVVRGAVRGWQWDLTGTVDTQRRAGVIFKGIDVAAANAAIAAGADPFQPFAPALVADQLIDRTVQTTQGAGAKLVATGRPLRVPAGRVTVTGTVETEQTRTEGETRGADPYAVAFGRGRIEGAVAVDVPLASRREAFLPWAGELSANASGTVRRVGRFGTLADATLGLNWSPVPPVQVLVQLKQSGTAPTLDQLAAPQSSAPQVSLFDFANGRSTLVTLLVGGNPDLLAERRRVQSIGATIKPFAGRELRIGATYETTRIANGVQTVYALTPETEAGLPDLFVRDANGALSSVAFRPTNIFRERQRTLNMTLSATGQIGRARPPATPGGPPPDRPSFYGGLGPTVRFSDRVELRPGAGTLDLLAGDTLSGFITPRVAGYGYGGINYLGNGGTFDFYCTGRARISGAVPASTLRFAPLCKANMGFTLSVHHFLSKQDWARSLGLKLDITNVTDARQRVRDPSGAVPYRYQPDLLDPRGRVVTLSLRKLF